MPRQSFVPLPLKETEAKESVNMVVTQPQCVLLHMCGLLGPRGGHDPFVKCSAVTAQKPNAIRAKPQNLSPPFSVVDTALKFFNNVCIRCWNLH